MLQNGEATTKRGDFLWGKRTARKKSILKVVEPVTGLVFYDLVDSLPTAINDAKMGRENKITDKSPNSLIFIFLIFKMKK